MDLVFYKICSKSIEGQVVFFWLFYFTSFVGVDSQCQKILNLMASGVKYQIMAPWWWCISGIFFFFPKLPLVHCRVWVISYFFCRFLSCKGGLRRTGVLCNLRGIYGQNMLLQNTPAERKAWLEGEEKGLVTFQQNRIGVLGISLLGLQTWANSLAGAKEREMLPVKASDGNQDINVRSSWN